MQHLDEGTIHAWLDGALPAEEARQAEMHAAGCAACAEAVAEARGLIAASSMIISKLDGVLGAGDGRVDGNPSPAHDIAARASADSGRRPARRNWFAAPGLRAAAALLFLAGGVAVVQNITGRDELARVVTDASPEAAGAREAEIPSPAPDVAMQDATAAGTAQVPAAPPPPTVGPAPALPRPSQAVGGMTPPWRDAPQGNMVGDVSGVLRGAGSEVVRTAVAPTVEQPAGVGSGVAGASVERAGVAQVERAELVQEQDFSAAKSAAAAPPPASLAAPAAPPAQRDERRQAEENAVLGQRLVPQAATRARVTTTGAAAAADAADGAGQCYVLTLSPWSPVQAAIPAAPATRIALSADTGTVGPAKGSRLVRPLPGAFQGSYDHAWYTEVSPSTLVLTWATGAEGIVMRLVRSGDVLTGTARTFGAPGSIERTSDVRGERVGCGEAR